MAVCGGAVAWIRFDAKYSACTGGDDGTGGSRSGDQRARGTGDGSPCGAAAPAGDTGVAINIVWTLVAGFLVMFMQAGFALVETGLCRAKNAAHVMSMNFLVYALGMTGFFICGYAFMCGGNGNVPDAINSVGHRGRAESSVHASRVGGHDWTLFGNDRLLPLRQVITTLRASPGSCS